MCTMIFDFLVEYDVLVVAWLVVGLLDADPVRQIVLNRPDVFPRDHVALVEGHLHVCDRNCWV